VLKVVWFGNKGNWGALGGWREIIESEYSGKLQLVTCSNHADADFSWSLDNLRLLLSTADIAVLPTRKGAVYDAKSPNRLIQCMAAGLPAITGPLTSYQELYAYGAPVLIANSDQEFRQCIDMLLSSSYRMGIAWASYQMVVENYAVSSVVDEWVELMHLEKVNGFEKILLCTRLLIISVWLKVSRSLA
jgi:glycosyltransferase involved in cell wall biosynthesis